MPTNLELFVEHINEALLELDKDGYIRYANPAAIALTGFPATELINKPLSILYHTGEDGIKMDYELEQARKKGRSVTEGWRERKDHSRFWGQMILAPLKEEQRQLYGYSCLLMDISAKKSAELDLRKNEDRYRMFVEQVADYAIFMMDEKGRIASWNEGARRIKGYEAKEIIGKYFSIFYPEEDILSDKPARELKIAQSEGKYEEEGWRIRKDGTQFWANVVITPVYTHEGKLVGYSKVTRDLTERKAAERALRDSFERYRTIAGELKVINSELSLANQELEQFTSIVSHDLQEPIRTIKSFLQLIDMKLSPPGPADLREYIAKAVVASDRMKELILNLLQYSQLAKTEISTGKVPVRQLFREALQNLKSSIEQSHSEISMDTTIDTVKGDHMQLVQLIQNLIGNAIKFTQSEKPQVKLSCVQENGHVRMSVSDNGIGIAEEDFGKVFEIFRRLNTKNKYPGTGIGLAICKKIVERHQGRIWPESAPGRGTTFHFTLHEENYAKP